LLAQLQHQKNNKVKILYLFSFLASMICLLMVEHFRSRPDPEQIDLMTSHSSQLDHQEPEVSPTYGPEVKVKNLQQLQADNHQYLEAAQVEPQKHLHRLLTTATAITALLAATAAMAATTCQYQKVNSSFM
jgi:hypothetical protein